MYLIYFIWLLTTVRSSCLECPEVQPGLLKSIAVYDPINQLKICYCSTEAIKIVKCNGYRNNFNFPWVGSDCKMDPLTYESQWIKCITQKQRKFVTNLDKRLNYCATISHALPYLNSSYELDNNFDAPIDVNEWRIQEQNYVETIIVIGGFLLCLLGVTFYLLRMRFKVETQKPIKPWKRPLSDEITQRYLNDQLFSITGQNSRSLLNSEQQELDEVIVETVSLNWDDLPGDNDFTESVGDTGGYYIDPSSSESLVFVEDPNAQHTKY